MMTMTQTLSLVSMFTLRLGMSSQVFAADDAKRLSQHLDYDGQTVVLDVDVGQANVIATDGSQVRIEVDIKAAETSWFELFGSTDVNDVLLATSVSDNTIKLALSDQDDINQSWRIYIPRGASLEMDMGVGQIEVDGMDANIDITLGVGSAQVSHSHIYQAIELKSGVGEVRINDAPIGAKVERHLVSQSLDWHANEDYADDQLNSTLSVKVGVGEVIISSL